MVLPRDARHTVIIDVSNLAYRASHAYALTTKDGRPSGHIYGSTRLLMDMLWSSHLLAGPRCIVYCYEGVGAKMARRAVVPEYKVSRDLRTYSPVPDVEELFQHLPGLHVRAPGREADDAMAWIAKRCPDPVIVSSDKDMWGLLGHARVFLPKDKVLVTPQMVLEKFGVPPEKIYTHKAVFGDSSDDISGIERLQKAKAIPCINESEDLEGFFAKILHPDTGLTAKTAAKVLESKSRIFSNLEVIKPWLTGFDRTSIIVSNGNIDKLRATLLSYECASQLQLVEKLYA